MLKEYELKAEYTITRKFWPRNKLQWRSFWWNPWAYWRSYVNQEKMTKRMAEQIRKDIDETVLASMMGVGDPAILKDKKNGET